MTQSGDAPISVTRSDAANVIRLTRPEKKNALTAAMYASLSDALDAGERDGDVAAHVIFGSPGVFCAGNDIADFMRAAKTGDGLSHDILRFITALATLTKPLLAGVDGRAVGIGTTLLFHCDVVHATPAAQFSTPFLDLGLVPEAGSSLLVPRVAGYQRAFDMLVMGTTFSAERALSSGFVTSIVDAPELEGSVLAAASRLAAKPPEALAMSRRLLKGDSAEIVARMHDEAKLFQDRIASGEAIQAFSAFLDKRAPDFRRGLKTSR